MATHYETLGVGESANADEIKKAYRKLASAHHPDKGGDTKKFQEIQTAYDTLSNDEKRQMYDMERKGMGRPGGVHFNFHQGGGMPPEFADIFKNFGFGGGDPFAQFRQNQQPRRNKDLRIEIPITLASTLAEQKKTISVQTTNGNRETVEVIIPRGVTTGTQIKYTGLGDTLFETLARGDLYVQITVQPDSQYVINGIDIYYKINVNCLFAIVGGEVTVNGLDGKIFTMTIPQGTQPGVKFRIADQGLYQMNSDHRGNLYIEIGVTVPQNITQEQKIIIQSLLNSL